jgi:hypothetical protein
MCRLLVLLVALVAVLPAAAEGPREFVQAVEFPYYLLPRPLWERELVWLKTIGVRTVAFSIPWSWHQTEAGVYDFTGTTSPRRDLVGLVRTLRRLEMRAWVRPLPPVKGMVSAGYPAVHDGRAQRAWLNALEQQLATQTASHGGPVAYVEGRSLAIDAPAPPAPVTTVSARDTAAMARSRKAIAAAHGALLWEEVEDSLYPAGWAADAAALWHEGAVGLNGEERPTVAVLRRNADLVTRWSAVFPALRETALSKPAVKWPAGVSAVGVVSGLASAAVVTNSGTAPFVGEVRIREPLTRRILIIPGVAVPPGESLWLPVSVSLGVDGLCQNCSVFSPAEHIVYATAELHTVEFENGTLAMEFAAPVAGEAVLQLARQPSGPFLAGGRPAKFDWDEKTLRVRLPIPAGQGPARRVRIALAMEAPETSAFFVDARRLIAGQINVVSTSYSSPEIAARSRLRLPSGYTAQPTVKSPVEIDYAVNVPADAAHGDWVNLALEADGVLMGRARLQLFRPASVRWSEAVRVHFGQAELAVDSPVAPMDAKAGRTIEIVIRNNSPQIQSCRVEAAGRGLSFSPPRTEIAIGAMMERPVSLRVFPDGAPAGLAGWRLRVTGCATLDLPMRLLLVPRGQSVAWSADLDGDGTPEWILENQKVRAVFSARDGGRWQEFTWKDTGTNFLPAGGAWAAPVAVLVRAADGALEFVAQEWKRTVRLGANGLEVEQTTALPADGIAAGKRDGAWLEVVHESPSRTRFALQ